MEVCRFVNKAAIKSRLCPCFPKIFLLVRNVREIEARACLQIRKFSSSKNEWAKSAASNKKYRHFYSYMYWYCVQCSSSSAFFLIYTQNRSKIRHN